MLVCLFVFVFAFVSLAVFVVALPCSFFAIPLALILVPYVTHWKPASRPRGFCVERSAVQISQECCHCGHG